MRNQKVLHTVKKERNILLTITRRKTDWVGHILRRSCLLKHIFKGKIELGIEVTAKRGRSVSGNWMTLTKRENTGN
jgi:hypothetical protein